MARFDGVLESRGPGVFVQVPDDALATLRGRRVPVHASVNGYRWRTTTAVYGGRVLVGLNKQVQAGAGVAVGDRVEVELERDDAVREVVVPEALAAALERDPQASSAFASLSYTYRKEYARWIADAKREETRERRLVKALELIRARRGLGEAVYGCGDEADVRTATNQSPSSSTSPPPSSAASDTGVK